MANRATVSAHLSMSPVISTSTTYWSSFWNPCVGLPLLSVRQMMALLATALELVSMSPPLQLLSLWPISVAMPSGFTSVGETRRSSR
ncbi:MAG: hypothetical protein HRT86_08920 [Ilumatobacteraceae bacterium]|nr:hypothetical protein [Ilumatobacteraceae bacterium]